VRTPTNLRGFYADSLHGNVWWEGVAEQTTTMSPEERQPRDKWSQKSDPAAMRVRGRNPADDESPGMEQGSRATGDSCSV